MFRIQPEIGIGPGAITGEDVICFIPGLRFPSYRQEQLSAKTYQQEAERSNLIGAVAFCETQIHVTSEFKSRMIRHKEAQKGTKIKGILLCLLCFLWLKICTGFVALSRMPALNGLAASCKFVDDAALATLPDFPSLTELVPMDVGDDGFRHIARCRQLESLILMYCRDTR